MRLERHVLLVMVLCTFLSTQVNAQLTGTLSPSKLRVSSRNVFQIQMTATDTIPVNTIVHFQCPGGMQNLIWPIATNIHVSTSGPSGVQVLSILSPQVLRPPVWDNDMLPAIISSKIKNYPLLPGETINITLGNPGFGGAFMIRTLTSVGKREFRVALEDTDHRWTEVLRLPFWNEASIPDNAVAILPSVVVTGETARMKLIIRDHWFNRCTEFEGIVRLSCDQPGVTYPEELVFTDADSGYVEVPVTFPSAGFYHFELEVAEVHNNFSNLEAGTVLQSNYAWVQDNPDFYIYWGDLHSHSGWSRDGQGPNSFNYARFAAGLDYFSPAEHVNGQVGDTLGINPEEWEEIKRSIVEYHDPGEFVTITAYETSYYANEGGHHIAYFEHDDAYIDEVPLIDRLTYHTIFKFWDRLDQLPDYIQALSWPHFTGRFFYQDMSDSSWSVNSLSINSDTIPRLVGPEYERPYRALWEIFSDHGQSEYFDEDHPLNEEEGFWFFQDALAAGERLGVTAFTDGHLGKPGYPATGLGATMAPDLERSALFDAFRARSTYGTTGERIIMDFRINGAVMGSDIEIVPRAIPFIEFTVQGTGPLDRVEILKWDFEHGTYDAFHPQFEVITSFQPEEGATNMSRNFLDLNFKGDAVYYMRVIQAELSYERPVWGWSSPIWVSRQSPEISTAADTLTTAVEEISLQTALSVSPNPVGAQGMLEVKWSAAENATVRIEVIDASGRMLDTHRLDARSGENRYLQSTAELPAGHYWLRIVNENGRALAAEAFVVSSP